MSSNIYAHGNSTCDWSSEIKMVMEWMSEKTFGDFGFQLKGESTVSDKNTVESLENLSENISSLFNQNSMKTYFCGSWVFWITSMDFLRTVYSYQGNLPNQFKKYFLCQTNLTFLFNESLPASSFRQFNVLDLLEITRNFWIWGYSISIYIIWFHRSWKFTNKRSLIFSDNASASFLQISRFE